MALSLKDWQLPNSRIWLAEIDIDRGLDFPIKTGLILRWKSSKLNYENVHHFLLFFFFSIIYGSSKKPDDKKK